MTARGLSAKGLFCSAGLYLILLAFVTWPAILDPALLASPPEGDRGANIWNLWWTAQSIRSGTDPRWTPLLFHPWGCSLVHHSLSLTNGVLFAPLTLVVGPAVTYGLAFFLWSILTGLGGMVWSSRWLRRREEQWLVGLFLTFSAYRFAHLDHVNLFTTAGLPWTFWAFDRLKTKGQKRDALVSALLWILTTFACWYYGVIVGIYGLCRLSGRAAIRPDMREERSAVQRIVMLFPFLAAAGSAWLYLSIPISGEPVSPDTVQPSAVVFWSLSVDALLWPLWVYPREAVPEFRLHPGIVFLLMAAIQTVRGFRCREEQTRFLLYTAALFALLSLGPFVKVGTEVTPLFMPAYLFQYLPGLCHMKVYARFLYPSLICLAPLAVRGMRSVAEKITEENPTLSPTLIRRLSLSVLIVAFWFEQGAPPFGPWPVLGSESRKTSTDIIKIVQQTDGPVLEIPFIPSFLVGIHLARQTEHGRPLVIGEISRLQGYRSSFLQQFSSLISLSMMVTDSGIWSEEAIASTAKAFAQDQKELGIRVVVVNECHCVGDARRRLSLFEERVEDGQRPLFLYDTGK